MNTPLRWLDDPELSANLRADLECVQQHPWQPDLARAGAALDAALSAEPSPNDALPQPTATAAIGGSSVVSKLAIVALSGGLLITASVWQLRPEATVTKDREPIVEHPVSQTPVSQNPTSDASLARREIQQLQSIYSVLERGPAEAYRLARASLADIPQGPLREEREGLAVIALWKSGEHATARTLALRFLAQYPESPLRERIRALLSSEPVP